jgi:hypothetical protein
VGGVCWTEWLAGWVSPDQTDFNEALLEGRRDRRALSLQLTLQIEKLDEFLASGDKRVVVKDGFVECDQLGGRLNISAGEFELFVQSSRLFDLAHLRMRYKLNLRAPEGQELRLYGFKLIEHDRGSDMWADTTTLFVRVHEGWDSTLDADRRVVPGFGRQDAPGESHAPPRGAPSDPGRSDPRVALSEVEDDLVATGVLFMTLRAFLRQLLSFNGIGGSRLEQCADVLRFDLSFAEGLAKTYIGKPVHDANKGFPRNHRPEPWRTRRTGAAWHVVPGREHGDPSANRFPLERDIIPFRVEDLPFALNLHRIRRADQATGNNREDRGPVLLIPGSGVRAEMFYGQPLGETLVDHLLGAGYDVWVENWRASIDLPNNSYTLDQAARLDHPRAVETVIAETGAETLPVVAHCQGSVSFLMAAVAGFLPEDTVSNVVSSAISLFFKIPSMTWLKTRTVLQVARRVGKGADAQWGIRAPTPFAKAIVEFARRAERPCGNGPCQVANYMYGSGWDVLALHDNLDDEVHAWSSRELGYSPFTLIQQVAESCRYGHIVPARPHHSSAPPSYVSSEPKCTNTYFTFIAGSHNRMFDPEGQLLAAEYLRRFGIDADFVSLEGYGHLDTFWGRASAADVFPKIVAGLQSSPRGSQPALPLGALGPERAPRYGLINRDERQPPLGFTLPPIARPRRVSPPGTTTEPPVSSPTSG